MPLLIDFQAYKRNSLRNCVDDEDWRLGNSLGIADRIGIICLYIDSQIRLPGDQRIEIPADRAGSLVS